MRLDKLSFFAGAVLTFTFLVAFLHFVLGVQYVVILTDSMEPKIHPYDLVVVKPENNVSVGEVVLYEVKMDNRTFRVCHRIVGVKRDGLGRIYYVTKGDNRRFPDPWRVYPDQIIGKVVLVIPKLGYLWLFRPVIFFVLFVIVLFYISYHLFLEILKEERGVNTKKRKELERVRVIKKKKHTMRRR